MQNLTRVTGAWYQNYCQVNPSSVHLDCTPKGEYTVWVWNSQHLQYIHIFLILSWPVSALSPICCMLRGEAANTNSNVFGLPRIKPITLFTYACLPLHHQASPMKKVQWYEKNQLFLNIRRKCNISIIALNDCCIYS